MDEHAVSCERGHVSVEVQGSQFRTVQQQVLSILARPRDGVLDLTCQSLRRLQPRDGRLSRSTAV